MKNDTCVYVGEALAHYGFGDDHPFGPERMNSFWNEACKRGLDSRADVCNPVRASQEQIESFHTHDYVERVKAQSITGEGYLDAGDTPAFKGVYEAASYVVGSVLASVDAIMQQRYKRAFIPIAGLHHARRDSAAGFCVFNDCGIAIEILRKKFDVSRVAYIDIDAHHGDGVFYSFEGDANLIFADIHEDGRYLYPGTGSVDETGVGDAAGTKLNVPAPPGCNDEMFLKFWPAMESFVRDQNPDFIILQCGADSLDGDPITDMKLSEKSHAHAATKLRKMADDCCEGRLLALGGGGYNHDNIARAWTAVLQRLVD